MALQKHINESFGILSSAGGLAALREISPAKELLRGTTLVFLGLVLPWMCHQVTLGSMPLGRLLMPLMIPVALAAFLLPLRSALAVAIGLPLLSFATSGMPPLVDLTLPRLILEGAAMVNL